MNEDTNGQKSNQQKNNIRVIEQHQQLINVDLNAYEPSPLKSFPHSSASSIDDNTSQSSYNESAENDHQMPQSYIVHSLGNNYNGPISQHQLLYPEDSKLDECSDNHPASSYHENTTAHISEPGSHQTLYKFDFHTPCGSVSATFEFKNSNRKYKETTHSLKDYMNIMPRVARQFRSYLNTASSGKPEPWAPFLITKLRSIPRSRSIIPTLVIALCIIILLALYTIRSASTSLISPFYDQKTVSSVSNPSSNLSSLHFNNINTSSDKKEINITANLFNPTTLQNNALGDDTLSGCQIFEQAAKKNQLQVSHSLNPTSQSPTYSSSIPKLIHFVHYNSRLSTPRYLCSIESAARHNPDYKIILHVKNANEMRQSLRRWLNATGLIPSSTHSLSHAPTRFSIQELAWSEYFSHTPLDSWFRSGEYLNSSWVLQNLGNAYRMGVLWKHGGTYLDLDIVSVNSLDLLYKESAVAMEDYFDRHLKPSSKDLSDKATKKHTGKPSNERNTSQKSQLTAPYLKNVIKNINRQNSHRSKSKQKVKRHISPISSSTSIQEQPQGFISKQDPIWFNNAFLSFNRFSPFLLHLMTEFVNGFKGYIWARNGPRMVTRTYDLVCEEKALPRGQSKVHKGPWQRDDAVCDGVRVLGPDVFYRIQYEDKERLFDDWEESCDIMKDLSSRLVFKL